MNILVVLRAVRDPAGFTVNRKAQKVFVNRERFIINPADRNALEAGLQVTEGSVTAVALGGETAHEVLRQARAAGAARAIWVPLPEAAPLDARGATAILQRVVGQIGSVDLVLLGAEVLDTDLAQVGPRLAAALDWPFMEEVYQARALPEGGLGLVVRAATGEYRLAGAGGPAVAGVARDCNKPRFAPAARIITLYQDPHAVEQLSLAELGLDEAQLSPATNVRGESFPPERTLGQMLAGDDAPRELARALKGS